MRFLLFYLLFFSLLVASAFAQTPATGPVTLKVTWLDSDSLAAGYRLYWGSGAGVFENSADIGYPTIKPYVKTFTLTGTPKICFAITAYNFSGESAKSTEFCQSIPAARVLLKVQVVPPLTGVPLRRK